MKATPSGTPSVVPPEAPPRGSTRGYWRVLTHAATRNTQVQFFGPDEQLLYEEALPEKWIRQNRKTQRQLDKLLSQILANQLLISRLKTENLPPLPRRSKPANLNVPRDSSSNTAPYKVHTYINTEGKVYVAVDNPERSRYKIEVIDDRNRTVYEEFTSHDRYRRRLDISPLSGNSLQVIVAIGKQRFVYHVKKQHARSSYSIQPVFAATQKD